MFRSTRDTAVTVTTTVTTINHKTMSEQNTEQEKEGSESKEKLEEQRIVSEENSQTTNPGGLSDYLTKHLLRDFEASGDSREDFDLLAFCNNNSDIYGAPASVLRRQVQLRWGRIKFRSIKNYLRFLKKHCILPVKATLAESESAKRTTTSPSPPNPKTGNSTATKPSTGTMSDDEEISERSEAFYSDNKEAVSIISNNPSKASSTKYNKSSSNHRRRHHSDDDDDDGSSHRRSTNKSPFRRRIVKTPPPSRSKKVDCGNNQTSPLPDFFSPSSMPEVGRQHVFGSTFVPTFWFHENLKWEMESIRNKWKHSETFGNIWKHSETFGNMLKSL